MSEIGLYEAMSTLRAVRRLRPDPIPDDVLERVPAGRHLGPERGQRSAMACDRRAGPGASPTLAGALHRPLAELHERAPQPDRSPRGCGAREAAAHDRCREPPCGAPARGAGHPGVLLSARHHGHYRLPARAAVRGGRWLRLSGRAEHPPRMPRGGTRLHVDDPAVLCGVRGGRRFSISRKSGTRARSFRSASRVARAMARSLAVRWPRGLSGSVGERRSRRAESRPVASGCAEPPRSLSSAPELSGPSLLARLRDRDHTQAGILGSLLVLAAAFGSNGRTWRRALPDSRAALPWRPRSRGRGRGWGEQPDPQAGLSSC